MDSLGWVALGRGFNEFAKEMSKGSMRVTRGNSYVLVGSLD